MQQIYSIIHILLIALVTSHARFKQELFTSAARQTLWQLIRSDLHGNYIPLYKRKSTRNTVCCVTAGQRHQCMGMNLKASLNDSNMNCKWIGSIGAAESETTERFQPSIYVTVHPLEIISHKLEPEQKIFQTGDCVSLKMEKGASS